MMVISERMKNIEYKVKNIEFLGVEASYEVEDCEEPKKLLVVSFFPVHFPTQCTYPGLKLIITKVLHFCTTFSFLSLRWASIVLMASPQGTF